MAEPSPTLTAEEIPHLEEERLLDLGIQPNQLDQFDQPTYHFRLYMMSDEASRTRRFGPSSTHDGFGSIDELLELRRRVMRRDVTVGMTKQCFTSFQRNARAAKSSAKGVTKVVNAFQDARFVRQTDRFPCSSPCAATQLANWPAPKRKDSLGMYATPGLDHPACYRVQYHNAFRAGLGDSLGQNKDGCLQLWYPDLPVPTQLAHFLIPAPGVHGKQRRVRQMSGQSLEQPLLFHPG